MKNLFKSIYLVIYVWVCVCIMCDRQWRRNRNIKEKYIQWNTSTAFQRGNVHIPNLGKLKGNFNKPSLTNEDSYNTASESTANSYQAVLPRMLTVGFNVLNIVKPLVAYIFGGHERELIVSWIQIRARWHHYWTCDGCEIFDQQKMDTENFYWCSSVHFTKTELDHSDVRSDVKCDINLWSIMWRNGISVCGQSWLWCQRPSKTTLTQYASPCE